MTFLSFRIVGCHETARLGFVGVEALVTVFEVHAFYFVFVHLGRGVNLCRSEVGLSGFICFHSDVSDNERTGVSCCLALLTGVSVDVGSVLLVFQLGELQSVAFGVYCNTVTLF